MAFEKYKKFVRRNFIGLSGLLITVGGIILTIVLAFRNTAKSGGNSTQKAGNEVKKYLPGMIGNILGSILQNTGKSIFWFGDHMMILVGLVVEMIVMKKR